MQDRYATYTPGLESPARDAFSVTPSDSDDLPEVTRALYVGGEGNVAASLASGAEVIFEGVSAGTVLPLRVSKILQTGTTATAIIGLV